MAIGPISPTGMSNVNSLNGVGAARPTTTPTGPSGPSEADGTSFGESIGNALDQLSASHEEADRLAVQAATGDLNAVHDYTIAATEAQLMTQLTVEVRNRAIEAFNDIMRMQV